MTLFNIRLDRESRREVFVPTNILGVSFYELDSSRSSAGVRSEEISCKIRIPYRADTEAGRVYLPESCYSGLSDADALFYWTLQKGAYILIASDAADPAWDSGAYDLSAAGLDRTVTKEEMQALCKESRYAGRLISVAEYSDNTRCGSDLVKHWRIGGR